MIMVKLKSALAALGLCATCNAFAVDTFDPNTNLLLLGSIAVNGATYMDVSTTVNSYSFVDMTEGTPSNNTFDPSTNLLNIGWVTVGGNRYKNVRLRLNSFVLNSASPSSYACDKAIEEANAPHTGTYLSQFEGFSINAVTTYERWPLQIDGRAEELNIAISRPPSASTPIRGIIFPGHGLGGTQAAMLPSQMVDTYFASQMASRGYLVVWVARRGNFGSSGDQDGFYRSIPAGITNAEWYKLAGKYQAASTVAVLAKMSSDPAYQPYMSTMLITGASGGADAVMQTAADSSVFQRATNRALVRLTGYATAIPGLATPTAMQLALEGGNKYAAELAKSTSTSMLWIGGVEDTTTSIGQLACQYKFFNKGSGIENTFWAVPGLGHFGFSNLFSLTLSSIFKRYLTSQGFAGFN